MKITFEGKYKSINSFIWEDIPMFSVITGANGTGKSQLLELIYASISGVNAPNPSLKILDEHFAPEDISFIQGEWKLTNVKNISLVQIQQDYKELYNEFRRNSVPHGHSGIQGQVKLGGVFREILAKTGKGNNGKVTEEEFRTHLPEFYVEHELSLGQKIAETFYNYHLTRMEKLAKGETTDAIEKAIGKKPWLVLHEIIKESTLPFTFNNPENLGFRDSFDFRIRSSVSGEELNLADLSSGEKVLFSLVCILYSSEEKGVFPKLLLMDEPDAHLHPTMSFEFIKVIKNVLVDKFNVRVIMTTHSPSTVVMTPEESIFVMSKTEPRISISQSKNRTISLLTAGLVYVGNGTKHILVEDQDDVTFYTSIYENLLKSGDIVGDVPLVFIPASTSALAGGKSVVQDWVKKLQESGLEYLIHGIIDKDCGNNTSDGVFMIQRYSIENYLLDPINVYACLMEQDKHKALFDAGLEIGEEYKLKSLDSPVLQAMVDKVMSEIEPNLPNVFADFEATEKEKKIVQYLNGTELLLPQWMLSRKGKTLMSSLFGLKFGSQTANIKALQKSLRKTSFIPNDFKSLFEAIQNSQFN